MNRKMVLLNLALIGLASVLVWQVRIRWLASQGHQREVLSKSVRGKPILAPPPAPAPKTTTPAEYIDVAQRTLFARDRNPNVVVEPPPAPPPPPPMPALPFYYGQMSFGEEVILLSLGSTEQKRYHAGDDIGPFRIVSYDRDNITFEWRGDPVERKLAELKPKETAQALAASTPVAAASAPAPVQNLSSISAPAQPSGAQANPTLGVDMGGGFRGCAAGDNSPAGTLLNGYRKVVARNLMGTSCHWEQAK